MMNFRAWFNSKIRRIWQTTGLYNIFYKSISCIVHYITSGMYHHKTIIILYSKWTRLFPNRLTTLCNQVTFFEWRLEAILGRLDWLHKLLAYLCCHILIAWVRIQKQWSHIRSFLPGANLIIILEKCKYSTLK